MAYIGNSPGVASQRIVTTLTATAGQTTFTPSSGYTVGYLDVYHNGVKLINGDDYTASNGSTFALASGAASGDVIEAVAYLPRGLSDGYTRAEADARYMDINAVTLPSQSGNSGKYLTTDGTDASWDTITAPTPAAVSDAANSSTGYLALPSGTTAQRPGSAAAGYTRYNTTTGSLEFYDGANWINTNLIPTINSITGNILSGAASTLTLSLTNTTDTIDVKYYEGGTLLATDSGVTVTSGSATSTVPSAVYGQTAGDTLSIQIFNQDGTPSSNSISKTVVGLPAGGTITTSGGYRYHTFTSSSTLTVPTGFSANIEALVVGAGGGGGCWVPGGGGAGGLVNATSAASLSISTGTYNIVVGAGGVGTRNPANYVWNPVGTNGGDSWIEQSSNYILTGIGGGRGGSYNSNEGGVGSGLALATNGGCGGGKGQAGSSNGTGVQTSASSSPAGTPVSATSRNYGFGASGGSSSSNENYGQQGGGGAGGVLKSAGRGQDGLNITWVAALNYGTDSSNSANSGGYFAGGGGAGYHGGGTGTGTFAVGGAGGGANGIAVTTTKAPSGLANTGGGGGGGGNNGGAVSEGGNGGSGIVIIRYQL